MWRSSVFRTKKKIHNDSGEIVLYVFIPAWPKQESRMLYVFVYAQNNLRFYLIKEFGKG